MELKIEILHLVIPEHRQNFSTLAVVFKKFEKKTANSKIPYDGFRFQGQN